MKNFVRLSVALLLVTALGCGQKDAIETSVGLYLPEDLEVSLWAESPMFYNPTNMDVDPRGRLWITEAVNYRNFNNDSTHALHHQQGDRVMILEDTNHDGKADVSKVFVADKDLVSPLGIAVIGNKVIVSCSPHMIIYTDANGDDVPDSKEIFLTGFGGLDHDHSLHAVVAGPDGKWYFNTGNAGPHIVTDKAGWTLRAGSIYTGGSPYNTKNQGNLKSDDGKTWVGGLALRIDPDGTGLKVMGHNFRNSYESIIDSYGNLWQNDNDDQVVACRTSWLMEGGNAGYFSTDGTRYWQADQRPWQDVFTAHWHQQDPGVMPAGDKSGAGAPTGITLYEGDVLGEQYRGMVLSADAGRNVVFGYKPTLNRSGYDLGARSNFITSLATDNEGYVWNDSAQNTHQDKWFRPSDVAVGTDGTLYVADWYDPVVGGHQMKDSTGYGRIYRITPKGKNPAAPKLDMESVTGLMEGLKSPAINVRALAFYQLVLKDQQAMAPVKELLKSQNPYHKARAVWLLANLGQAGKSEVLALLSDPDVQLRATAFRAWRQLEPDIVPVAQELAKDTSAFLRREVAVALRDLPFNKTVPVLVDLARQYKGDDKWYLESIVSACRGHEGEFYQTLLNNNIIAKDPAKWTAAMSSLVWSLHPEAATGVLMTRAGTASLSPAGRSEAITALAFIDTKDAVQNMLALTKSALKDVAEQATYWVAFRQGNDWFSLVDWSKTGIDMKYERAVATMKVKMSKIMDKQLPFDEKKWNAQDMANDAVGGQMLITMVSEDKLPRDLYSVVSETIFKNPDMAVRIQASNYFKKPGAGKSYSVAAITALTPDAAQGRSLFLEYCTACHRVKSDGQDIGPELTLINKKFDKQALLDAIINPNAGIVFGYEPWLITLKGGESYYGFLVADGEKTVVVKDLAGRRHVVETSAIIKRTKQDNSLMPEPSTFGLTEQNLADLSTYLMSVR